MPITSEQRAAIEKVINVITNTTAPGRGRRNVSTIFMSLVDRNEWPEYFEIIPEPRCLNNIKAFLEKNRYRDCLDVYTDLALVFWNALFYNEEGSQITHDAETLKKVLEAEWKRHTVLPTPRSTSPPPQSAQKVHKTAAPPPSTVKPTAPTTTTTTKIPAPPKSAPAAAPIASSSKITRQVSPEIEVDVSGMSPEPEGHSDDPAAKLRMEGVGQRDSVSEEIVTQLERSLPRWPGFVEQGWWEEGNQAVYTTIVHAIKSHKDVIGNRLASSLEEIPEVANWPTSTSTAPLSLKIIENRVRSNEYATSQEFDKEMIRLFEKARRWHEPCTESYGNILLLQRFYQALTSSNPPSGPPYSSTTNFASLRAGPGNVKPVHGDGEGVAGVTNHRVITREKKFVDEVHYKGWTVKLADWLHLSNPDDPTRPIIAQVFRCWISEEESKKGQVGITVSWYYRPEQTYHPPNRVFWEGEVFKTSHFAEHPLADIIEKIACQFTARHIRGRPRAPFWWPGFPLYVCDSRYNDRDRIFVRIKNWNSCIPEEVRKSDEFMPIYPFERAVYPSRLASPFLTTGKKKLKGPGGLLEQSEPAEVETTNADGTGRKSRRALGDAGHSKSLTFNALQNHATLSAQQHVQQTPGNTAQTVHTYQQQQAPTPSSKPALDRTVLTAAGGPALGNNVHVQKLPPETTRHFDRDPKTNEVLWFSSPPVNAAPAPTPRHSLAYLHFLAKKRKSDCQSDEGGDDSSPSKKNRFLAPPTVLETLAAVIEKEKAST
ncbi:hypothetical protein E1B28_009674 [Marasmius oreades]|uniref:Uncharacterized protein n=1 Tax=Marasmius oreades TaxID=181124 RepID=A0A9P7RVJ1_9AGAR|nr:uncharacterized protein E1B28_009674 [Marasmius oreades]KAG7090566.1 hypothetical protein E1B28_009674 [Marasmius oreades]